MGLERPTGNVIVNTVWCKYSKVNEQSGPHTVAKYAKTVQKIASINL